MNNHTQIAKKCGFKPEQIQDPMMMQVGDCGAAQPVLLLTAALETAKPEDLILWASYGSGADVILLKVTEQIAELQRHNVIEKFLSRRRSFESYTRFLSFRGILEASPGEPFKISPSTTIYWRDQNSILPFHGSKCKQCGSSMFPVNRICYDCKSKDNYEEIRLYDREFTLYTFSIDRLAGRSDDPMVGQAVAEDRDGTRIYLLMTDFEMKEVEIGMKLECTFRKMHTLGDFVNYYWKLRPTRRGE